MSRSPFHEARSALVRARGAWLSLPLALLVGWAGPAPAQGAEVIFDTDRGLALVDSDGDSYPDLTERREGTDLLDPEDFPGRSPESVIEASSGFPSISCRAGFRQAGSRLCINEVVQDANNFSNAAVLCRDQRAYVCGYEELRYLYLRSTLDAEYNPNGRWLGDWTSDDTVLCGNRAVTSNNDPDIGNFDGTCNRFDSRNYWCCHDDE